MPDLPNPRTRIETGYIDCIKSTLILRLFFLERGSWNTIAEAASVFDALA
ncbi:hypothetical protein HanIR_Chr07g0310151 [Helianthus annuus]|nr:hypothetical protein HanIR_Chr07g0310151 [Helianthus annuus]